jgi:aminopeptidase N
MPKVTVGKRMENNSNYEWDIYQKTPKMSTYTLAFAVLYDHVSVSKTQKNKTISASTFSKNTKARRYNDHNINLNRTANTLSFYEDYFNMTDVLPKLDSLDSPHGRSDAMENWGLITYFEGTFKNEKTIAHELAHYWIGNAVTAKSWSE